MNRPSSFLRAPAEIPPDATQNNPSLSSLKPCCVGDDVPGVGFVHSACCAASPDRVERFGDDASRNVPALSATEEEAFRRLTADADAPAHAFSTRIFLKAPHHTCCDGVDLPGIGHTHAADCPAVARRAEFPATLGDYIADPPCRSAAGIVAKEVRELIAEIDANLNAQKDHNTLLAELIFAARDLAEHNILGKDWAPIPPGAHAASWCRECQMTEHLGGLSHTDTCRTGRVQRIIASLVAPLALESLSGQKAFAGTTSNGKETAANRETGRAGDGIRPRALTERVCLKCGGRGGRWLIAEVPAATFDISQLGLNQLVGTAWKADEVAIFTHRCEDHSAKVDAGVVEEMLREGGAQ